MLIVSTWSESFFLSSALCVDTCRASLNTSALAKSAMSGSLEQRWWSWHQCIMAISHLMHRIPKLMRFTAGERLEKLSAISRMSISVTSKKSFRLLKPPLAMMELWCWTSVKPIHCKHWSTSANAVAAAISLRYVVLQIKGCNLLLCTLVRRRADGVVEMISFDTLNSRMSPIGEVLRQVVRGCSSRRTICHHRLPSFAACESKRIGSDKPKEKCLSTEDASSIVGCSSDFHADKRSEWKVSLPLCSLTIWYYCYALTLRIAKPDPTHGWHLELNTSLGTTTWNQPNQFGTVMKGETANITHLCEFGWYDWVYCRDNAATYPNDKWVLGRWLGP